MKLFKNGKHWKTVPKKYLVIQNKIKLLVGDKTVRLTVIERATLDVTYNKVMFEKTLDQIKAGVDRYVFELIQNAEVDHLVAVSRRQGDIEYRVHLKNAPQVRVELCEINKLSKYGSMEIIQMKQW